MFAFDFATISIVLLTVVIAGGIHGYAGFGWGIVSITIYSLSPLDLERGAAITTILGVLLCGSLLAERRERTNIQWKHVGLVMLGIFLGQPFGYWILLLFKDLPLMRFMAGLLILLYGVLGWRAAQRDHFHKPLGPIWGIGMGFLGGVVGGAIVSGGPPILVYLFSQKRDPRDMKSTVQVTFLISQIWRLVLVGLAEPGLSVTLWGLSALSIPVLFGVAALMHRASSQGTAKGFRRVVYGLLAGFGLLISIHGAIGTIRAIASKKPADEIKMQEMTCTDHKLPVQILE
jgi:uncharacterized protein